MQLCRSLFSPEKLSVVVSSYNFNLIFCHFYIILIPFRSWNFSMHRCNFFCWRDFFTHPLIRWSANVVGAFLYLFRKWEKKVAGRYKKVYMSVFFKMIFIIFWLNLFFIRSNKYTTSNSLTRTASISGGCLLHSLNKIPNIFCSITVIPTAVN